MLDGSKLSNPTNEVFCLDGLDGLACYSINLQTDPHCVSKRRQVCALLIFSSSVLLNEGSELVFVNQ